MPGINTPLTSTLGFHALPRAVFAPTRTPTLIGMEYMFGGKYLLGEEVAVGGCGTVFQGVHKIAGKEVAIKVEPALARSSPLQQETKIYRSLQGGPGVPWMMWAGKSGEFNVMVIDLLGSSLEDLFQTCNRHFSLKTVLMLGVQLVRLTIA